MSNLFNSKHVKTRKAHRCDYCQDDIEAGTENVLYEWGIFDGSPFSRYTCHECEPYVDRFWRTYDKYEEGLADYEVHELWQEFMEVVAGEPYRPVVEYNSDGSARYSKCGYCGHMWWRVAAHNLPDECPACGGRVVLD